MYKDEDGRRRHDEMGFHEGWGKALDQLVETARAADRSRLPRPSLL